MCIYITYLLPILNFKKNIMEQYCHLHGWIHEKIFLNEFIKVFVEHTQM